MKYARPLAVLCTAALLALGTGCGSDSNSSNNGASNNGGADAGTDGGADAQQTELPQDWEFASEYYLRFTKFQFDDSSPGSDLNTLLRNNINHQEKKYPVVVLVHLKDIDTDAGTLSIRGGAGIKADLQCDPELDGECQYKWDAQTDASYVDGAQFDADTGHMTAHLDSLDFIATFELDSGVEKAVIPVTDLTLDGYLLPDAQAESADAVVMQDADLEGYLTEEAADNSQIQLFPGEDPKPLSMLLGKDTMNYDQDGDGTNDAWFLTGKFTAHETVVVQ